MRQRLSNPFAYYTEWQLIGMGLTALLAGSLIGWLGDARYDGVLDLHFGPGVEIWQPLLDNVINICSLFVPLYVFGLSVNRKTRLVDILSTVLVARVPYYGLPLINVSGFVYQSSDKLLASMTNGASIDGCTLIANIVFFALAIAVMVIFILWLFKGFQTATNSKKTGHLWVFAGCILMAEVISKLAITLLNY